MIDQEEFGAGHIGPPYGIFQGPPGLYPRECLLSQGIKNLRIKFPSKCPGISPSSIHNLLVLGQVPSLMVIFILVAHIISQQYYSFVGW